MGNSLRRIILAPAVPYEDVVRFAEALRAAQVPALLTYCTLDSSTPRRAHVRAAKQAGVRVVDLDTPARSESLLSIADETLPRGNYLYRYVDDEDGDECIPSRDWLQSTFPGLGSLIGCSRRKSTRFPGRPRISTPFHGIHRNSA